MFKKFNYKNVTWIDVESPTPEECRQLGQDHNIPPLILEELTFPSQRSKVDVYSNLIYLVLHFPFCQICTGEKADLNHDRQEVDFVIGRDFIITAHYEPFNPLTDFAKIFGGDLIAKKEKGEVHAGFLFYYIMRETYNVLASNLNFINDRLKTIERRVFANQEIAVVRTLAEVNRELLDFRWTMKNHKEILLSLEKAAVELFDDNFRHHLRVIIGEHDKIWNMIDSNRSTFLDLRETNESLIAIKTNQTMKALTVLAFIFLPLTIISQIFSMNTAETPIVGRAFDFYLILGLMAVTIFVLYLIARLRRWL